MRLRGCRDLLMEIPGEWSILRCDGCGLQFTAPRADESELLQYYPPNYHVYHPDTPVRASVLGGTIRRLAMAPYTLRFGKAEQTFAPFGNKRFLDVGCGAGGLLEQMSAQGWSCTGIDISPTAVAVARKALPGVAVEQATLATFKSDAPFALISMQHVLEHLPNPVAGLARCRQLLEPGGALIVAVPNIDSLEARAFGRRWIGLDIPRHVTHFSSSTLPLLLERSGFEIVRMRPAMFASSLSESALLSMPRGAARLLLGSKAGRLLYFASVLPASISYLFGNEPVIEVLSRRAA
jgi:SAM-dependent methyltransferase